MNFWAYLLGEPQPADLKEIQGKVVKEFERKLLQELAEHPMHPFQEEPLPDQEFNCPHCGTTPHRFQPSPEAGPYWRCSNCGEPRELEDTIPHMTTSKALDAMWEMQTEEQQRQVEHLITTLRPMVKELMDAGLVDGRRTRRWCRTR